MIPEPSRNVVSGGVVRRRIRPGYSQAPIICGLAASRSAASGEPRAARNFSASSAAMQPMPAAVTAWRKILSCTSPAAKTPGDVGRGRVGRGQDVAFRVHLELALEQCGRRVMADGDEDAVDRQLDSSPGLARCAASGR